MTSQRVRTAIVWSGGLVIGAVLTFVLVACVGSAGAGITFMDYIESVCDEHGNRVYHHTSGGIAVVSQDPTCKEK